MLGEDEHGYVKRWIVSPPAVCVGVVLPWAFATAEHPAAHHDRSGRAEPLPGDLVVGTGLASVPEAVRLAEAREPEGPLVQSLASFAERMLEARVRPGDEPVE